jgi:predicted dehydrogenase
MADLAVGIVGAGAIGRLHAGVIERSGFCRLAGIADPSPAGQTVAETCQVPYYPDHAALFEHAKPQAVIVATPNTTHVSIALDAIAAGIVPLVEKPVAESVDEGERLAAAAERTGVPVLVGHHRRHNPIIQAARSAVQGGLLGTLTNVTVLSAFYKHDAYFETAWRRSRGGGPILINLIHEIDLIRFVCGEIASVQAFTSNSVRGFEVEDTAAVLLRLTNGALATISLSDTAVAPWTWDLASGELSSYPPQPAPLNSHYLSGTDGSLTLPGLEHWRYDGERSWFASITRDTVQAERASPYLAQLRHLCHLVRREELPVIDAADATRTLRATLAVVEAARTGKCVEMEP